MTQKITFHLPREKFQHLIFSTALLCIAGTLPYSIQINSICIIIFGVNWLFSQDIKEKLRQFYQNKYFLLFASLYVCYAVGLLYSHHLSVGFGVMENKLSLLIFPLILSGYTISRQLLERVMLVFAGSCFIAVIISTFTTVYALRQTNDPANFNYREELVAYFGFHPTYLSIYLLFSVSILAYFIYHYHKRLKLYQKILVILLIIYFSGVCLLLASRMPFVAFLLIYLGFIYYLLYKKKKFVWVFAGSFLLIGCLYFLYKIPALNQRFVEILNTPLEPPVGLYHNSTNIRVGILLCSYQVLKQHWVFGVGTGDMQTLLNECYQQSQYSDTLYEHSYDPHNQFIEIWLNVGIVGWLILVANFVVALIMARRHKSGLYIFFLLFVMLCCNTESLLNVQKGVVFYSFFNSLFATYLLKRKNW